MFNRWYCSCCCKKHSKKIPIAFHWQGFWEYSKADFCSKYLMKGDKTFKYNRPCLNTEEWILLFKTQQIQLAKDILNGYSFRRQSNGESIYTKIINVLKIEEDIIVAEVEDEYGNCIDLPISFLFDVFNGKEK